jgi:hypothetical protein
MQATVTAVATLYSEPLDLFFMVATLPLVLFMARKIWVQNNKMQAPTLSLFDYGAPRLVSSSLTLRQAPAITLAIVYVRQKVAK